ncbi:MAG: hypothetical protein J7501_01080 [Bdellovibrio sp.]|nr:hypothetical protein [Bdellovibrio sp.]
MKLLMTMASLVLAANAYAGTGDYGSAGSAPASVNSTIDQIEKVNSQADALSILDLCRILSTKNDSIEWGKAGVQIKCYQTVKGLIEIRATNSQGTLSVFANRYDKTVLETTGADEIHRYSNDLGQSLVVVLSFSHTGERVVPGQGVLEMGVYRPDISLYSGSSKIRVGYYIQEFVK